MTWQTMSTLNKLPICITLALPLMMSAAAPAGYPLAFQLERKETVCIGKDKSHAAPKCGQVIETKSLDNRTKKILNRSVQVGPVFSQSVRDHQYLVFISRVPSRTPQSPGYCGAGYEDYLVLLEYDGKKISMQDEFLLQSCLKSIALDTDNGDDISKALVIDLERYSIKFRWLTNPDDKDHTISISDGKFMLN
jgi:hypothetical protein